jgi:hypothetical protein
VTGLKALNQDATSDVFSEMLKDVFCDIYASIVGKGQGINKCKSKRIEQESPKCKGTPIKSGEVRNCNLE